jgi:hypothetical protein
MAGHRKIRMSTFGAALGQHLIGSDLVLDRRIVFHSLSMLMLRIREVTFPAGPQMQMAEKANLTLAIRQEPSLPGRRAHTRLPPHRNWRKEEDAARIVTMTQSPRTHHPLPNHTKESRHDHIEIAPNRSRHHTPHHRPKTRCGNIAADPWRQGSSSR